MTSSIRLKRDLSEEHLNRTYATDYYSYLQHPEFHHRFLRPIGSMASRFESVLDIGCGEGWLVDHLDSEVRYLGIDGSEVAIQRAQRRHSMRPHTAFLLDRLEDLSVRGQFDTVVVGGILDVLVEEDSRLPLLQVYIGRFNPVQLIIYDLVRLDTESVIEHSLRKVEEFVGTANVPGIPAVKRTRKVQVYRCRD